MLSNLAALALYADTFVVSGNSNLGRFAMLLAGPERMAASKVVALDLYWFASIFVCVRPLVPAGPLRPHPRSRRNPSIPSATVEKGASVSPEAADDC
jgi:hypothetical protein